MEKLVDMEYTRYYILEKMKQSELNGQDISFELEYLKYFNNEIQITAHNQYYQDPAMFYYKYRILDKRNREKGLIDIIEMDEDKQIEYRIYLDMKQLIENDPKKKLLEPQKTDVYIEFLKRIKRNKTLKEWLDIKYNLAFSAPDLTPFFLLQTSTIDQKTSLEDPLDIDRIRVIECRKINDRLKQYDINQKDRLQYTYYLSVLLDQIKKTRLQMALKVQLMVNHRSFSEDNVIPNKQLSKKELLS